MTCGGIDLKLEDQDGGEGGHRTVVEHYWKSQPQPPLSRSTKSNIPCTERGPPSAGQPGIVDENTDPHKAGIDVDVEWCSGTKGENRAGFLIAFNLQVALEDSKNGTEHSDVLPFPKVLVGFFSF